MLPENRGKGIGRALHEAFTNQAETSGYEAVRLDTLQSLDGALALYRTAGFVETSPYKDNANPGTVFMELNLEEWRTRRRSGSGTGKGEWPSVARGAGPLGGVIE